MDATQNEPPPLRERVRLTSLAHGGGCGCKLAPAILQQILASVPLTASFPDLLVGTETADDAAIYRLNDGQAIVATTDFFMPVVDDPFQFGRIAATNALSDIYAMGATPILALAVLGMPLGRIGMADVQQIVSGGASICAEAGIPIAGGHSIDSQEPIYGLVVLGIVDPKKILKNSGARPGDALILTKGLGVGIFSAALRQDRLDDAAYAAMIASTTQLNAVGRDLAARPDIHAMTDVTGFGLLGHAWEMARGAGAAVAVRFGDVPVLPGALGLAAEGIRTGASARNWDSYGQHVRLASGLPPWGRDLLCDPQTSGGLLVAVAHPAADEVLGMVRAAGFAQAAIIGEILPGAAEIRVS